MRDSLHPSGVNSAIISLMLELASELHGLPFVMAEVEAEFLITL